MPHSKAKLAEVADRRARLVRLRRAGVRFDDQRILTLGYSTSGSARKDLIRALEQARDEEAAEISIYRQQENERLDALLQAVWDTALEGDPRAVETVLKLMDRRAKLNGLDAPVRTELSGPDGGAVPLGNGSLAELNALISIAGQSATTDDSADNQDADGDNRDQ